MPDTDPISAGDTQWRVTLTRETDHFRPWHWTIFHRNHGTASGRCFTFRGATNLVLRTITQLEDETTGPFPVSAPFKGV